MGRPQFWRSYGIHPQTSQIFGIDTKLVSSFHSSEKKKTFWNLRRKYSKKRRKNIYHHFFTKKEGSTYKKRRKYIYFIISKKEGFLLFKKEKHTFLTFFFYQKRWKKEGNIAPPYKWLKSPLKSTEFYINYSLDTLPHIKFIKFRPSRFCRWPAIVQGTASQNNLCQSTRNVLKQP